MKWDTHDSWMELHGKYCIITIEPRPTYCDRGNWIAKVHVPCMERKANALINLDIDDQDGWPRYYFDLDRAKLECEAWLKKRNLCL